MTALQSWVEKLSDEQRWQLARLVDAPHPTLLTVTQAAQLTLNHLEHDYQMFSQTLTREFCHECEAERRLDGSWYHEAHCFIGRLLDAVRRAS